LLPLNLQGSDVEFAFENLIADIQAVAAEDNAASNI